MLQAIAHTESSANKIICMLNIVSFIVCLYTRTHEESNPHSDISI